MFEARELIPRGLGRTSFCLGDGECIAVRGRSGAGKTVLLRALADLDVSDGQVFLDGVERSVMPGPQWRKLVGYVPAEPGWWGSRVEEHFEDWFALRPMAMRLNIPATAAKWPIARLSTGERSRLALLRMLEVKPKVLLLDEPTAALDPALTAAVEQLMDEQLKQGLSIIWVTHDDAQAARVAKRWLVVEGGLVREIVHA